MTNALDHRVPKFRTEGPKKKPKVILVCSACDKDIRQIKMDESIRVDRAYYCEDCDPGVIVLNPAHPPEE